MRDYIGDYTSIDGRTIWYRLVNASDYLKAKYRYSDKQLELFTEERYETYGLINQIMAIKQSCFLLRRVSHSCGSLSDNLFNLKLRLIHELRDKYNFEFDDDFVEGYGHENESL